MSRGKIAVFALLLAGAVALAVSTVAAQNRPENQPREGSGARVFTLAGRGAQIGVSVADLMIRN